MASSHGNPARPYGRLQIFTLLDEKAADFDRLAERTAEQVRLGEPDTLVYAIHSVPDAPMQRIFYEIYRDRAALDSHENKSYIKRFTEERRAYVLATNVIELRLKYAKVAPLPQQPPAAGPARPAPPTVPGPGPGGPGPGGPAPGGPGPGGPGPSAPSGPWPGSPRHPAPRHAAPSGPAPARRQVPGRAVPAPAPAEPGPVRRRSARSEPAARPEPAAYEWS